MSPGKKIEKAEKPPIQIKADRNGFMLIPDPVAPLDDILAFMDERLEQSHNFFHQTGMVLDLRTRPMRTDEISALYAKLYEKAMVKVVEVRLTDGLSFSMAGRAQESRLASTQAGRERGDRAPVIVRNTCRSGVRIVSQADCVVLGDVNPGAEIIADGDVIVFGALRGVAHAGAGGERSARIWALSIEPNQIRIADLVAVPPQGPKPAAKRFEVAEIQKGVIQVISL